jgi:hypothetical protein
VSALDAGRLLAPDKFGSPVTTPKKPNGRRILHR